MGATRAVDASTCVNRADTETANSTANPHLQRRGGVVPFGPSGTAIPLNQGQALANNALAPCNVAAVEPPRQPTAAEAAAVQKMRDIIQAGDLSRYYNAAIGTGDARLQTEALALFEALPVVGPGVRAEDMVSLGLWSTAPKGIAQMQATPRYLPGRQLIVRTTVDPDIANWRGGWKRPNPDYLSYDAGGQAALTYRAMLVGDDPQNPNNFLVKVDGNNDPISLPKEEIYALNNPHSLNPADYTDRDGNPLDNRLPLSVGADYTDVFTRAKVIEAAIKMDLAGLPAKLDFTQAGFAQAGRRVFGSEDSAAAQDVFRTQRDMVRVVYSIVNMDYPSRNYTPPPGRVGSGGAGRMAIRGYGVCFTQAGTTLALLAPFAEMLGVDIQFISGVCPWRDAQEGEPTDHGSGGHGWLQLTYRPSATMRVLDRTWNQHDHTLDRAYSPRGDRYPGGMRRDLRITTTDPRDVDMRGVHVVEPRDREFAVEGDGAENHQWRLGQTGLEGGLVHDGIQNDEVGHVPGRDPGGN